MSAAPETETDANGWAARCEFHCAGLGGNGTCPHCGDWHADDGSCCRSGTHTRADAHRLRELLAAATPGPWSIGAEDDGTYSTWSPAGIDTSNADEHHNAALIVAAVNALPTLLANLGAARERVRVVEGERDAEVAEAEREHEKTLAIMEAACDRADALQARAESAEAAHEAEKAALIALADTWERDNEDHLNRFGQHLMGGAVLSCAEHLRSLLGGGEAR